VEELSVRPSDSEVEGWEAAFGSSSSPGLLHPWVLFDPRLLKHQSAVRKVSLGFTNFDTLFLAPSCEICLMQNLPLVTFW
jgi:hypothetical protein